MLQNTFLHLQGIGEQTEQRLWEQGFHTWDQLADAAFEVFSAKRATAIVEALEESRAALEALELRYFQEKLKSPHMWRLAPYCEDAIAYLDIETTGLGFPPASHSTTMAILFCGELFVEHDHEKKKKLLEMISAEAKMLVTFNGLCFDLPFLRREFGLELAQPHVDLRVWFRKLGHKGGLKKIQMAFPEIHQRGSMDIDGFDAVRLWRMHLKGVPGALETLMTYNAEDALVLEPLLHLAYLKEKEALTQNPLSPTARIPLRDLVRRPLPEIETKVDPFVYGLLRGHEEWQLPQDW